MNEEIKEYQSAIANQEQKNNEKNEQVIEFQKLKEEATKLDSEVNAEYEAIYNEEKEMLKQIVKSESFVFFLQENVHSFALFKDYFTEDQNLNYDPSMKISKNHVLCLEDECSISEGSRIKSLSYNIGTILHENSFQYY